MKKILVANRGEIALRIMRSAREMGIQTVAVYADADRTAPHVQYADEAVHIGESPSNKSYLIGTRIVEAAQKTGADAIHPGYGFLSENAEFAELVAQAGLIFIGPDAHAIRTMGSKLAAKEAAKQYQIPMVPGSEGAISDVQEAIEIAQAIGFPILIKASAGGGGKGMRIVEHAAELAEQMERAMSEALSAFGDGSVFIEKYVASPRHIEIQVLADKHGNTVHLFERECSVQRRHQKVVEEAPSAILTPTIREAMGTDAIKVAQSCAYVGAGTVEFLVDEHLNYYFLEMNTRLQVEHPVTEMITGVDLVKEQIRVARGERLRFGQSDLQIKGHAVELRVYAEDPENNFLPSVGVLSTYQPPQGKGVRVDDGYRQGMEIPIFYDPMIAKLIAYADTRQEAIDCLVRAIDEYRVTGVATTLPFGRFVLRHEAFVSGKFDTHFVKNYFKPEYLNSQNEQEASVAAIFGLYLLQQAKQSVQLLAPDKANHTATAGWKKRKMLRY
jgi:acetyl-CoA carboxylase biotin carboxylase subunit